MTATTEQVVSTMATLQKKQPVATSKLHKTTERLSCSSYYTCTTQAPTQRKLNTCSNGFQGFTTGGYTSNLNRRSCSQKKKSPPQSRWFLYSFNGQYYSRYQLTISYLMEIFELQTKNGSRCLCLWPLWFMGVIWDFFALKCHKMVLRFKIWEKSLEQSSSKLFYEFRHCSAMAVSAKDAAESEDICQEFPPGGYQREATSHHQQHRGLKDLGRLRWMTWVYGSILSGRPWCGEQLVYEVCIEWALIHFKSNPPLLNSRSNPASTIRIVICDGCPRIAGWCWFVLPSLQSIRSEEGASCNLYIDFSWLVL